MGTRHVPHGYGKVKKWNRLFYGRIPESSGARFPKTLPNVSNPLEVKTGFSHIPPTSYVVVGRGLLWSQALILKY